MVQITFDRQGSYMSFTAEQLRVRREDKRRQRLAKSRTFESTLIPGPHDNNTLLEVCARLRTASVPKGAGRHRRQIVEEISPLTVRFYSKNVEDFTTQYGSISAVKALASARVFRFEGQVTVTRQNQVGGGIFYNLTDGQRWLSIGVRGTPQKGLTYTVLRSNGFTPPTGRAAGHRTTGRGPRFESE